MGIKKRDRSTKLCPKNSSITISEASFLLKLFLILLIKKIPIKKTAIKKINILKKLIFSKNIILNLNKIKKNTQVANDAKVPDANLI